MVNFAQRTYVAGDVVAHDDMNRIETAVEALTQALINATSDASGLVELATNSEAVTGTDTSRAVTPAGVKAVGDTKQTVDSNGAATRFRGFVTAQPANLARGDYWFLVG